MIAKRVWEEALSVQQTSALVASQEHIYLFSSWDRAQRFSLVSVFWDVEVLGHDWTGVRLVCA